MRWALATASIGLVALAIAGILAIGSDEDPVPEIAPPPETADPVPPLPPGWVKTANAAGGFALGVPPGWSARSSGATTTLRSPGSAAVVRVTADRSESAVGSDIGEYATLLLEKLGARPSAAARTGAATGLEAGAGYEIASATGEEPGSGPRERLTAVVVRRPELAAFPLVVASAPAVKSAELDPIVAELVASLRGREPR